jgi:hypothetical protein
MDPFAPLPTTSRRGQVAASTVRCRKDRQAAGIPNNNISPKRLNVHRVEGKPNDRAHVGRRKRPH